MTLNLTVRSDVIDIKTDNPRKGDIFLVDTNVWLWYTYPNSTRGSKAPPRRDITPYLKYLTKMPCSIAYGTMILSKAESKNIKLFFTVLFQAYSLRINEIHRFKVGSESCRFVYRESNVIKSIKIDRQKEVLSWQKEGWTKLRCWI
jgi:hypothetical protein